MGNQGMTNWKFSMFFVIALTLVAGLFADTALAGNGDGTMVLTFGTALILLPIPANSGSRREPLATPPTFQPLHWC